MPQRDDLTQPAPLAVPPFSTNALNTHRTPYAGSLTVILDSLLSPAPAANQARPIQ